MSRCKNLLLILSFVVIVINETFATDALRNDLVVTESFFQKLNNDYGSELPEENATKELDEKIANFVKTLQSPIRWRNKRHLEESPRRTESGEKL